MDTLLAIDISGWIYADLHVAAHRAGKQCVGRVFDLIEHLQPTHVVVAFDGRGNFRKKLTAEYKAARKDPPEGLRESLQYCHEQLTDRGVYCMCRKSFEADDLCASLAAQFPGNVVIASRDGDLRQCLSPRVKIIRKFRSSAVGVPRVVEWFLDSDMVPTLGVEAWQYIEYSMLIGKSTQWSGAVGIGPKTASRMLARYSTIEGIREVIAADNEVLAVHEGSGSKEEVVRQFSETRGIADKMEVFFGEEALTRKLATLVTDIKMPSWERLAND